MSVSDSGVQGDNYSTNPVISADLRFVAFHSVADNLVPGDTNGDFDVFVFDRATETLERVSVDSSGGESNGSSDEPSISADGRFVAFTGYGSNLVAGDTNQSGDVFVRDRALGTTVRVSVDSSGAEANADCNFPSISADGRFVAFMSLADNLVSGDTNHCADVFVRDLQAGTTERVSVSNSGAQADSQSNSPPAISADGNFVVFWSTATNLVANDTNNVTDVFIRNRQNGTTRRVSIATGGAQANKFSTSSYAAVSADGRYVTFTSAADNLVAGDTNGVGDAFVRDRQAGTTERVSLDSTGQQGDDLAFAASISADGRFVGFISSADNLVAGDTNAKWDAFLRDRMLGETTRVSVGSAGTQGDADSYSAIVAPNGRLVVFSSDATNLVPADTNGEADIFLHDSSVDGANARASVDSSGTEGNGPSARPALSVDGSLVAFESDATNLVANDGNGVGDVFVRDAIREITERASVDSAGVEANGTSSGAALSADGNVVAFQSLATNLVANDANGVADVFVHDRASGTTDRVSVDSSGTEANGASGDAALSADGAAVAFTSSATNLVANDTNGVADVFVHDRSTGATERVSVDSSGGEANGASGATSISSDGRFVAFESVAGNLGGAPLGVRAIYVRDRSTGTTECVSVDALGNPGNGDSEGPSISADGRFVAFASDASNLVAGDANGLGDVFLRDRANGTTERVSLGFFGDEPDGASRHASVSTSGRFVMFTSLATNLVVGDTNLVADVFVRDRVAGLTERISVDPAGAEANGDSGADRAVISADGRFVGFGSLASNLVAADTNGVADVFVRDRRAVSASWWNYGAGFPGTFGVPSFTATSDPILGTTLHLFIGNSSGRITVGLLFLGFQPTSIHSVWGGDLLVNPVLVELIGVPWVGASIQGDLPDDDALRGVAFELQSIQSDLGAAHGVSFTPGLEIVLGR